MDYPIFLFDTYSTEQWKAFRDDQFDFVMGCQRHAEFGEVFSDTRSCMEGRLTEVARIVRPGGGWFVWPRQHCSKFAKLSPSFQSIAAEKKFRIFQGK